MLANGIVPVLRTVHPDAFPTFLSLARDRLGINWAPPRASSKGAGASGVGASRWPRILGRLQEKRDRCFPEVEVTVLAYLDEECNVE